MKTSVHQSTSRQRPRMRGQTKSMRSQTPVHKRHHPGVYRQKDCPNRQPPSTKRRSPANQINPVSSLAWSGLYGIDAGRHTDFGLTIYLHVPPGKCSQLHRAESVLNLLRRSDALYHHFRCLLTFSSIIPVPPPLREGDISPSCFQAPSRLPGILEGILRVRGH